jgi:radical SAM superfamily enzyme YgiQ (UPF0313 family)
LPTNHFGKTTSGQKGIMVKQGHGNRKKILLVNPACLDDRAYGEDAGIVPIGLYTMGAVLIEAGFDVKIINLAGIEGHGVDVFTGFIAGERPDIIGFSVNNPTRWNAVECARAAKQIRPELPVVFGGPAPTFLADHLFAVCPDIDFIVMGEGEITFLELVKELGKGGAADFEQIKGIVYRQGDTLVRTDPRPPVEPLDTLVHPSKYFTYHHVSMSRGCPGNCTFCGSPQFWPTAGVRFHSPLWFADEIQALVHRGVHHFYVCDDTFTMDKPRVMEFCRLIIHRKLDITWSAISRVDAVDEDILFSMRRAGCIQLSFGVESGSEKIRKILGKPISREKIITAFSLTASYGIMPRAYFIYGSPGETDQTIQESCDLLDEIKPLAAVFYLLVIFPGTHLYRAAVQKGLVTDHIWHEKVEDLPWFQVDTNLDFETIKAFGHRLRTRFYSGLDRVADDLKLVDIKTLYPFHADFLSRLAMTFFLGEYAGEVRMKNQEKTAERLFEQALVYAPEPRAFLGLAMLLQKRRRFDRAIQTLDQGLAGDPENKELNICKGVCLMNTGRFTQALEIFERFRQSPETGHYITVCHQHMSGS